MAVAIPPLAYAAGELAAQLGVGLAASKAIDVGINKAIPYGLHKAKEVTSKYKATHGLSKALGKAEEAYNSSTGKKIRNVATMAGSMVAFGASGKMTGGLKKGAGAVGRGLGRGLKSLRTSAFKKGAVGTRIARGAAKNYNAAKIRLGEGVNEAKQFGEALKYQAGSQLKAASSTVKGGLSKITKPLRSAGKRIRNLGKRTEKAKGEMGEYYENKAAKYKSQVEQRGNTYEQWKHADAKYRANRDKASQWYSSKFI